MGLAIHDLGGLEVEQREVDCDVCIVGAGAGGVYLASRLAALGTDVVLIEAGGAHSGSATEAGFNVDFGMEIYPGATRGRAFGLGGTTTLWGGLLVPHSDADRRDADDPDCVTWAHIIDVAKSNADKVLCALGYQGCGDFWDYPRRTLGEVCAQLRERGLETCASLFLPIGRKNLSSMLTTAARNGRVRCYLGAVAKEWRVDRGRKDGARVSRMRAVARNRRHIDVTGRFFIIAAGALESARILLEIDAGCGTPAIRDGAAVGCYLSDHLSTPVADVPMGDRSMAADLFGPRFVGGWMRSFRFVEAVGSSRLPRAFAHFVFETSDAGFRLAREVFGALQARRPPKVSVRDAISGFRGIAALAYARQVRGRLHVPHDAEVRLQLDVEQSRERARRVELGDARDPFGRRCPVIHWRISDTDRRTIEDVAARMLEKWPERKEVLPRLIPRNLHSGSEKPYDAFHPVGTCRMGGDREAVVDLGCQVRGIDNVWIASTAVLPTAGTANPTFTMLCLAEDLAGRIGNGLTNERTSGM